MSRPVKYNVSQQFVMDIIYPIVYLETGDEAVEEDSRDRGGMTKFGIASRYYPDVLDPDFGIMDAIKTYKDIAVSSGSVQVKLTTGSKRLTVAHMHFCVNVGDRRGMKLLQTVINRANLSITPMSSSMRVKVDGIMGPKTAKALDEATAGFGVGGFTDQLLSAQSGWYLSHSMATDQEHFAAGWQNRVINVGSEANLDMFTDRVANAAYMPNSDNGMIS
jgi:lysozyme family protein